MSKYLGLSGHIGRSNNCNTAGINATPNRKGQPSFVPNIIGRPKI
jgi:hypothetical protein